MNVADSITEVSGFNLDGLHSNGPCADLADKLMLFGQFVGDWEAEFTAYGPQGGRQIEKAEWQFAGSCGLLPLPIILFSKQNVPYNRGARSEHHAFVGGEFPCADFMVRFTTMPLSRFWLLLPANDVSIEGGHRALSHGGEVSGFTAENIVFPDERAAVAVLTNQDASGAASQIAHGIAPLLFATDDPATSAKQEQARKIFEGLQHGTIDRSLFTDNANSYFSEQALKDFAGGLAPLGALQEFTQVHQGLRGGMTLRVYRVRFAQKTLRAWTFEMPDGKLEQYQIAVQE